MRGSGSAWREMEKARARILKTLEDGQNMLNQMRGCPPCTSAELVSMRTVHSREQDSLSPPQRLRSLLDEEQFVYLWNYFLVLLSNLSGRFRSGSATAPTHRDFERKLILSEKARTLYTQGDLKNASRLVSKSIRDFAP